MTPRTAPPGTTVRDGQEARAAGASAAPVPYANRYRWVICALLFLATTINYVDRQILSLLKPVLDAELGWNNAQFGLVNGAFQAAYGLGLLGFGWFVDRFGTRIGYVVSITLWSLAAFGHALVASVAGFRWARVSLGIGEAGNWPTAMKAVAEWFPQEERASATGLFNSGTMVGAILAPATIPYMASRYGWRAAFIAAGMAGFVWLVFWLLLYRTPAGLPPTDSEGSHATEDSAAGVQQISWLRLLLFRQTWAFAVGKALTDPIYWFYLIWLPDFFNKTQGLDLKKLGPPIVVIYSIATVLSISGARLSDYGLRRGWSVTRSRKLCMLLFVLCELPILLEVKHSGLWGAVLLIGLACGIHQALAANFFTTVTDIFPKQAVASVIGLGGTAGCIGGMVFPYVTGRILDHFTEAGNVSGGYALLFGICCCSYVGAFVLNHLLAPRFERVRL
jgi:MFS transporter, ACS family, hexuronate transporter